MDSVSSLQMERDTLIETRQAMVAGLPVTSELLRGSSIERTLHHTRGCTICTGDGGNPLWVLTVGYAGGSCRQDGGRAEPCILMRSRPCQDAKNGNLRLEPDYK
jgi:hypothetical protein